MGKMVRLQTALAQLLIPARCEEVGRVLNEATSKDASYILRATVESILGLPTPGNPQGSPGWGLRGVTRSAQPKEFDTLRAFLGTAGPLLGLTYRLASDPYLIFEFPVACLPAKSRAEIEEGSPSGFYVNKVQYPGPGKPPANILLNAFEYYMFHFAHFLVGAGSQRWALSWSTAGDALYPSLLEDYLTAFLPCDGSLPPGPPSPPVSPRGVLSPVAPRAPGTAAPNLYLSSLASPTALRPLNPTPQYFMGEMGAGMGPHTSSPLHHSAAAGATAATAAAFPHGMSQMHLNVWTSQVLVQVFMEMWVNQCLPPSPPRSPAPPRPGPPPPVPSSQEVFVPSSDHVRVVRMLIKHLHFFANSGKAAQPSPLDSLRKNLWNMYRKSLYQFLCHTFKHWPLDSSFRLVLETWLSYIQPWRYTEYCPPAAGRSPGAALESEGRGVEGRWQGFVAENLLFYSLLFHHLLLRLFRLDLSAPRNAQILFRVTKVFSQPNLSCFIQEIEDALEDPHLLHRSLLGPSTHPHHALGHKGGALGGAGDARSLASLARSHYVEMEGPGHSYLPMFGQGNVAVVESLMKHVRSAYEVVCSEQQQQQRQPFSIASEGVEGAGKARGGDGWWCRLVKMLFDSSTPSEQETTADDLRKTVIHLETAQRHLAAMFGVSVPPELSSGGSAGLHSYQPTGAQYSQGTQAVGGTCLDLPPHSHDPLTPPPQHIDTASGPVLTAYGRQQLMSGMVKRRDISYEGDPELRLICSYEVPCLVRWLYALCLIINTKYEDKMAVAYHKHDLVGYVARLVLQAPQTIYEYRKHSTGAPHTRLPRHIPPRLSLRFQASKHTIGYELAITLLLHMFGLWGSVLWLLAVVVVVVSLPAYLLHRYLQKHPRTCATPPFTPGRPQQPSPVVNLMSAPGL